MEKQIVPQFFVVYWIFWEFAVAALATIAGPFCCKSWQTRWSIGFVSWWIILLLLRTCEILRRMAMRRRSFINWNFAEFRSLRKSMDVMTWWFRKRRTMATATCSFFRHQLCWRNSVEEALALRWLCFYWNSNRRERWSGDMMLRRWWRY